jgi:predicted nucleic acid-binding protein
MTNARRLLLEWIAATARCHRLVLLTRDAHFSLVEGLTLEAW